MPEQENVSTNGEATAKKEKINHGPFASVEEAQPHKPAHPRFKLFRVMAPDGKVSFVWQDGPKYAIMVAAKAAGWSATELGKAPTKEKVGDLLGQLAPEDRAALLAQYVPPSGKGKK
jgi:hypothetical protein